MRRYTQQPAQLPRLDYKNPLTRNLVFCAFPIGGTYIDLVTGVLGTPQGTTLTQSLHASNGGDLWSGRGLETTGGDASTDGFYWPISTQRGGTMVNTGTLLCLGGSNAQTDGHTYPVGGNTDGLASGNGAALHIDSFALNGRGNVVRGQYSTGQNASLGQLLGNPFNGKSHFFGYSFNANGANGTWFGDGVTETWSGQAQVFGTTTTNRQACVLAQSVAGTATVSHNAFVQLFLIWDRELSANEYLALHGNLWQLFQYPSAVLFDVTAASVLIGQACL